MNSGAGNSGGIQHGELHLVKALKRSFDIFSGYFTPFFLLAILFYLPYELLDYMVDIQMENAADQNNFALALGLFVLVNVCAGFAETIIVYSLTQELYGQRMRFSEALSFCIANFLPLAGMLTVYTLAIFVGFMFFLIPGLFLMTIWLLMVPVFVIERKNPFQTLSRSFELTSGNRVKLFGLTAFVVLVALLTGNLLGVGGEIIGGDVGQHAASLIWKAMAQAFLSVMGFVLYNDIRTAKEGKKFSGIANVFE